MPVIDAFLSLDTRSWLLIISFQEYYQNDEKQWKSEGQFSRNYAFRLSKIVNMSSISKEGLL